MKKECLDNEICFYRCNVCGNVIIKMYDSTLTPQCCGRDMEIITPNEEDASIEKHVPSLYHKCNRLLVDVGTTLHPMSKDHYIVFVALKTNLGIHIRNFNYNDEPRACFHLCDNETIQSVYAYCNIHKLWKK